MAGFDEPIGKRIEIEVAERLHEAEAGHGIKSKRVTLHHASVADMQPDGLSLGDEITDGQHQAVIDDDAVAGTLGA